MEKNLFQRKSIIILVFICILSFNLNAQIRVNNAKRAGIGIGINETINPKASLEIRSNINGSIGGLLLPIVANVSDVTSPIPPGLIVYQSSSQEVCYYNTAWVCLSSPGGGGGGQVISRDGTTLNLSNNGGSLPNSLVPETGTTGYVLTKTATGYEWQVSTGGNTDLSLSTGASPVSLNSSSGSDVTITAGNNITLSSTSSNVTINATEVDGSVTNEIQSLSQSATPGKNISISSGNTLSNVLVPNDGTSGQVLTKTSVGYDWQDAPSINDLDGVIGNEVLDAFVNGGLVRTGLGTAASPYKLGLPDALTGQVMKFNGTGWFPANDNGITTEIDGVIGNEVLDATVNGGLVRAGTGSAGSPYTLGLPAATTDQVMKFNGTSWVAGTDNGITSEVDGSTTNEGGLTVSIGTSTTSVINSNTNGSTPVTITAGTGLAITETGNTITLSNTGLLSEVDGSITNEIQSLSQSASPGKDISISSGNTITNALVPNNGTTGQVLTKTATGYDWQAASAGAEIDGVIGNEVLDATVNGGLVRAGTGTAGSPYTLGLPTATNDQVMKFNGTSWVAGTDNGITSEVDGLTTNEGVLGVATGLATTSVITSNTSGAVGVTLEAGANITLSETASANGGNILITGSPTNLGIIGSTSPLTLNSSTGTDVTFTAGTNVTLTGTTSNVTINATEVDGSTTNELQTLSKSASPGKDIIISSGNTLTNSLVPTNGTTGQILTKTATGYDWQNATAGNEVDGVIGNEVLDATTNGGLVRAGSGTAGSPYTLGLPAANANEIMKFNGINWFAGPEIDGSITNEGSLSVTPGASNTSVITSNTIGSPTVTVFAGNGLSITETTNSITLTNTGVITEVDGSITNEGLLGVAAGTTTSSIITSNTSSSPSITLNASFPDLQISENLTTNNITISNQTPVAQLSQNDTNADTPLSHSTTNSYSKIAIPAFSSNLITTTTTNEISIPASFPGAVYKANYSFCLSAGSTENFDVAIWRTTSANVQSELKFTRSKKALTSGVLDCFSKDVMLSLSPGDKIDLRIKKATAASTTSTIHTPVLNLIYMHIAL